MTQTSANTMLSTDPAKAVSEMITITKTLRDMMAQEMNAVAANDGVGFLSLQHDKDKAVMTYNRAAREFQTLEKLAVRKIENDLLDRLEQEQRELGQIARSSVAMLGKLSPQERIIVQQPEDNTTDKDKEERA